VTSPIFTTAGHGKHHRWDSVAPEPILLEGVYLSTILASI
jgi:hypothetical protein